MASLEIDTDGDYGDVVQVTREMATRDLLALYRLLAHNPTPYQLVADELSHRARHERKLQHDEDLTVIDELGLE